MVPIVIAWCCFVGWIFVMRLELLEVVVRLSAWFEQHIQEGEAWPPLHDSPLRIQILVGVGIVLSVLVLLWFPFPQAMVGLLGGGVGVRYLLRRRHLRLRQELESQLVEMLTTLASSVQSGMTVVQALHLLARRQPYPLGPELQGVARALDLGCSWDEALLALQDRIRMPTLEVIISALTYGKSAGVDLPRALMDLANTLTALQREGRRLETSTAQARLQLRVMTAVVPGLALLLYTLDSDLMSPLWSTPKGWLLLCAIVVLQAVSWMVTRQILRGVS